MAFWGGKHIHNTWKKCTRPRFRKVNANLQYKNDLPFEKPKFSTKFSTKPEKLFEKQLKWLKVLSVSMTFMSG